MTLQPLPQPLLLPLLLLQLLPQPPPLLLLLPPLPAERPGRGRRVSTPTPGATAAVTSRCPPAM